MKKTLLTLMLCASTGAFAAITNFPGEDAVIKQDRQNAQARTRANEKAEMSHKEVEKNPLLENAKPTNYGENIDLDKNSPVAFHYLSTQDVAFGIAYNKEDKVYRFELYTKDGQALKNYDFVPLPTGNLIEAYWVNSKLSEYDKQAFIPNGQAYVFNMQPKKSRGKCEALYVRYQLKGDKDITTHPLILGKEGLSSAAMSPECEILDEDWNDTIDFTRSGYTAGFNWNSPAYYTTQTVKYTTFFTKQGVETFPDNIQSYAISRDFTHFYRMNQKLDRRGAYYGAQFSQNIEYPGTYMFITVFDDDQGKLQKLTAKNRILPGNKTIESQPVQLNY